MHTFRNLIVLLALVWSGWISPAKAVTLQELTREALANNPEVLAAQKRYEAARQRPSRESALPDPTLSLGYASNGGPLPGQQLGSNPTSNIGFMVSQDVPYPGKRRLRGAIASKEAEGEYRQYQQVQLRIHSRVAQAFHKLHHAYAGLEVLHRGKELLTRFIDVANVRYSSGKAPQQDIFKAHTQLTIFETRIIRMQQDLRSAESEINMLLNRAPGSAVGVPVEGELKPLAITLNELLRQSENQSPDLRREQTRIERGELALNLARKDLYPDYTISGGYFNQGSMPPMYQFRVDLKLPFYASRKQQPAIHEQAHLLNEARRNFEAADQNLHFRIRDTYQVAETSYRLIQLYLDTLLPQSDLTVESSVNAYQTGASDFLSVLTNLLTKLDSEERYHEEMLNYSVALATLEELTGVSLDKESGQ